MARPRRPLALALITLAALSVACAPDAQEPDAAEVEAAPEAASAPTTLIGDFATPESVLYDADQDVYFVSNINGSPLEADDNGYISRIDATTRAIEARWIDGANEQVTLGAPKGMAISGDTLWVSDIDVVRGFDRRTGVPVDEVAIAGVTFLNDLAVDAEGRLWVSDSGLTAGEGGFSPSGTDAIYRIDTDGSARQMIAGEQLARPNGLVALDGAIWAVGFGGNELFRIADDGTRTDVVALPAGSLDGIVVLPGGDLLISSWETSAVYRGPVTGPFEVALADVAAPADLGYDSSRGLLLVPLFQDDSVLVHGLE